MTDKEKLEEGEIENILRERLANLAALKIYLESLEEIYIDSLDEVQVEVIDE